MAWKVSIKTVHTNLFTYFKSMYLCTYIFIYSFTIYFFKCSCSIKVWFMYEFRAVFSFLTYFAHIFKNSHLFSQLFCQNILKFKIKRFKGRQKYLFLFFKLQGKYYISLLRKRIWAGRWNYRNSLKMELKNVFRPPLEFFPWNWRFKITFSVL